MIRRKRRNVGNVGRLYMIAEITEGSRVGAVYVEHVTANLAYIIPTEC
jgi:hypothetical protein